VGDASNLESLDAYLLRPESPMIDAGLDLRSLNGTDAGLRDFYGVTLPQGSGYDIGASESEKSSSIRESLPGPVQGRSGLDPNYPNPFNPQTVIPTGWRNGPGSGSRSSTSMAGRLRSW